MSPPKIKKEDNSIPLDTLKHIDIAVERQVREYFPMRMVKIKEIKEDKKDPVKRKNSLRNWTARKRLEG